MKPNTQNFKPTTNLVDGWISVKEKLPEHENNVLAVLDGQVCIMNYFPFEENGEITQVWGYVYDGINGDGIYDDNYNPTHWMEIPSPPACQTAVISRFSQLPRKGLLADFSGIGPML